MGENPSSLAEGGWLDHSMIVQIYEIQTVSEAEKIMDLGVDHAGSVVLSPESWKNQALKETVQFIQAAGLQSSLIPLFQDMDVIRQTLDFYQPDIIHFCDALPVIDDLPGACEIFIDRQRTIREAYPDIRIMRSIPIRRSEKADATGVMRLAKRFEPVSDFFLTDTLLGGGSESDATEPVEGFIGITGTICDWHAASALVARSAIPVILAGGVGPDNVREAIQSVSPAGVDSCTQTNDVDIHGNPVRFKKDREKVRRLVVEARRAAKDEGQGPRG